MMAYWESIYDYEEMDKRCEGVPFSCKQLRSRPTVPGFYWVDVWNDGQWELVDVHEGENSCGEYGLGFYLTGSMTRHDVTEVKGKWVGPLKPTRYSW
jgi:hypothetical protein